MRVDPQNAEACLQIGIVHLNQGNLDAAMTNLTLALRLAPTLANAYFYRGQARAQGRLWDEALNDYNQTLLLEPGMIGAYLARGDLYAAREDYKAAYADLSRVLQSDPRHVEALVRRGAVLAQGKAIDRAIEDFTRAIQIDPIRVDALRGRGMLYAQKSDEDSAIADFARAIRQAPDNPDLYIDRGQMLAIKGNIRAAFEDFSRAVDLNPASVDAYLNRAKLMYSMGEYERAITDATSTLSLDPDHASAYFWRARAYLARENYPAALADSQRALEVAPAQDAMAYKIQGDIYYRQDKLDDALRCYTLALKAGPDKIAEHIALVDLYLPLGQIFLQREDVDNALKAFQHLASKTPNEPDGYYHCARLLFEFKDDAPNALRFADQTLTVAPDYVPAFLLRARIYGSQGRMEQAVADLDTARRLAPDNPQVYYSRGVFFFQFGQHARRLSGIHAFS